MSETRRGGLGRGLAALIPTGPAEAPSLGAAAADVVFGPEESSTSPEEPDGTVAESADDEADNAPHGAEEGDSPTPAAPTGGTRGTAAEKAAAAAQGSGDDGIGAEYREISLDQIEPNPKQPRQVFDEAAQEELVHSIREFGLLQPIVVREVGPRRFQLIMGERRWRASLQAQTETIPAIVRDNTDDTLLRDALLENIHRVQLNPLEEASAYQQLLDEFGVTHDDLANKLGRSRPVISNTIRLLQLTVPVQRRVAAGVLSAGHARALLSLEAGPEAQEALAARVVAEGMSVRATEEAVVLANKSGEDSAPKPKRRKPIEMPGLQDVAERLSDDFDTRVTVSMGKKKGKIVFEFGTVDDLERIITLMNQQESGG